MENISVREGIFFGGKMFIPREEEEDYDPICKLYIEGRVGPIYELRAGPFPQQAVDQTFQAYIRKLGLGRRGEDPFPQIENEQHRLILLTYADEQARGVDWRIKSFRFLPTTDQEGELAKQKFIRGVPSSAFILTSDKSDIRDIDKFQIGTEVNSLI